MPDLRVLPGHAEAAPEDAGQFREGDIIFQNPPSSQGKALELATYSAYMHCGILLPHNGTLMVYEAVSPVRFVPVQEWIDQGIGKHYVLYRLADESALTSATLEGLRKAGALYKGKAYDWWFGWSDEKMYCPELVWKLYREAAGIELCPLRRMRDFDLSSPVVKKIMAERYGDNPPLDEPVVAPSDLSASPWLVRVDGTPDF